MVGIGKCLDGVRMLRHKTGACAKGSEKVTCALGMIREPGFGEAASACGSGLGCVERVEKSPKRAGVEVEYVM